MVIAANTMTNSDFLAEVYGDFEPGTFGWVCSFRADPAQAEPGMWAGRPYQAQPNQAAAIDRATQDNTYFCTAVLRATADAELVRRKDGFYRLSVLVLDDVQLADLQGYSYAIQTSPGKYQVGIFIDGEDPDSRDLGLINRLMQALSTRGFIKADASGNNPVRLVRLPYGMNTKQRAAGPWQVKLEGWNPKVRWSLEDACAACGIDRKNEYRHRKFLARATDRYRTAYGLRAARKRPASAQLRFARLSQAAEPAPAASATASSSTATSA